MSAPERVAAQLATKFPGIDPALLARRPPFCAALAGALAVLTETEVTESLVQMGALNGARNAYGVLIGRLRELPSLDADRRRFDDEDAETRRWAAVDRAARRGETLRQLVQRGDLFPDEAAHLLAREFDDGDLRGIAETALAGGAQ